MTEHFSTYFASRQQRVNAALNTRLAALVPPATASQLSSAVRYSVLGSGKRVRPILAYAAFEAAGGAADNTAIDHVATAVELLHCYSLIHDDLPAMDDDDLRRGRLSCHRAFDEATAILAGDALQAMAFETLTETPQLSGDLRCELLSLMARACGPQGMVGGQMLDLLAVDHILDITALEVMHRAKTGALICAALEMAAVCASASAEQRDALIVYGNNVGLAFQVIDDVLDVEAETSSLGKRNGADSRLNKPTYPSLLGVDRARHYARELQQQACAALVQFGDESWALRELASFVINRGH